MYKINSEIIISSNHQANFLENSFNLYDIYKINE